MPVLPGIDHLRLINSHLVTEGRPYLSNMSWWCELPLIKKVPGEEERQLGGLLTAFDINLGEHVLKRFERTVDALRSGIDPSTPLVTWGITDHLGITLRIPNDSLDVILEVGREIILHGLPLAECPGCPSSEDPEAFHKAASRSYQEGAELFGIAFGREAQRLFKERRDSLGYLLARFDEGLSYQRLGQNRLCFSILMDVYVQAKALNATSLIKLMKENFPTLREEELLFSNSNEPTAGPEGHFSPFVFDSSSGKVLGGQYAEEAETEFEAAQLLDEGWKKEFPGMESPFKTIAIATSFEWEDESFVDAFENGNARLGQLIQLVPPEGGKRLANVGIIMPPVGYSFEDYTFCYPTELLF